MRLALLVTGLFISGCAHLHHEPAPPFGLEQLTAEDLRELPRLAQEILFELPAEESLDAMPVVGPADQQVQYFLRQGRQAFVDLAASSGGLTVEGAYFFLSRIETADRQLRSLTAGRGASCDCAGGFSSLVCLGSCILQAPHIRPAEWSSLCDRVCERTVECFSVPPVAEIHNVDPSGSPVLIDPSRQSVPAHPVFWTSKVDLCKQRLRCAQPRLPPPTCFNARSIYQTQLDCVNRSCLGLAACIEQVPDCRDDTFTIGF